MPTILNKSRELVHREPGVSNQRPKGPFGQVVVVGNGKAPMRGLSMPEDDVAPVLFIEFVTDLSKCLEIGRASCRERVYVLV